MHREPHQLALIATILGVLFLNGGEMVEEELVAVLEDLKISVNEPDAVFGPVWECLEELKRTRYLVSYRRADDNRTPVWMIGPRGKVEFPPESLAECALDMARASGQEAGTMAARIRQSFGVDGSPLAADP